MQVFWLYSYTQPILMGRHWGERFPDYHVVAGCVTVQEKEKK